MPTSFRILFKIGLIYTVHYWMVETVKIFLFRSLSIYLNIRYYYCTRRSYFRFCLILSNFRCRFKNKRFYSIPIPYVVFSNSLFEGNPTCSKIEINSSFQVHALYSFEINHFLYPISRVYIL